MGILNGLFADYQFDPHTSGDRPGPGWLGPIAGGPIPFGQPQPSQGFPPVTPPSVSPARPPAQSGNRPSPAADDAIGRAQEQQNPLMSLIDGIGAGLNSGIAGLFGHGGSTASEGPSLLDRLTAGATNLTTGGNPLAGILNAVNGLATGQRTDAAGAALARQQATMRALTSAGYDPVIARAAAMNPDVLKAIVAARYGASPASRSSAPPQSAGASDVAPGQPSRTSGTQSRRG